MLEKILETYRLCTYDFRLNACPEDPLSDHFEEWVDYYRMKWAIAKTIKPASVLEIGVRYGYSARAFLDANPKAMLTGIDIDLPTFGGHTGAVDWAEKSLASSFNIDMLRLNSQSLERFPREVYDLIHVDGQQDGDGTFHDLDLASTQARYILVDGYHWTRDNYLAVNEWLWLNKAALESTITIPGYAGELLIRTKISGERIGPESTSDKLAEAYTEDYYLNDCGGYVQWRRSNGETADPRLQAVADIAIALGGPEKVVDLGAGRGELTRLFARQGIPVTAIDYSSDSENLIKRTLGGDDHQGDVKVICDSVLNPEVYEDDYDLAVASDIVEHLSPAENETLYGLVSQKLELNQGALVIHTAPNLWRYLYEHPRQQRAAKEAGFWLPRTQRTWYERLMHINEQNPRVLKKQLSRHFPHVLIWFTDDVSMVGSLLRPFRIADFRRARSIFAVASHRPIDKQALSQISVMTPLSVAESSNVTLQIKDHPKQVETEECFEVSVMLKNETEKQISSREPNQVHLSYHWLSSEGALVIYDGLRSTLDPPLAAGRTAPYTMRVEAPTKPGQYRLHLCPVQELIRWHESEAVSEIIQVSTSRQE